MSWSRPLPCIAMHLGRVRLSKQKTPLQKYTKIPERPSHSGFFLLALNSLLFFSTLFLLYNQPIEDVADVNPRL